MAAGLPVVATRAGGVEEAAIAEHNAYLTEPADAHAFAKAMIRMARTPEMAEMGVRGRQLVQERFQIEHTWCQYYELFQSLAQRA
jgi:glycosyltransferase involved in cell wall biosynthesis